MPKIANKKKTSGKKNVNKKMSSKAVAGKTRNKVSAIPKGYHSVTPYLIIENAAEAIEFYKIAFGAKVVMRMETPNKKIAHAELKIGDAKIMVSDENPQMAAYSPKKYSGTAVGINLYVKNVDSVIEKAVSQGAQLIRPIENMFYGDRSGTITDPYGHQWNVATHIEDVTPAKIRKRAADMFAKHQMHA